MTDTREPWVILKSGLFYRDNRAGYVGSAIAAGHYTEIDAKAEAAIEPKSISAHPLSDFRAEIEASYSLAKKCNDAINPPSNAVAKLVEAAKEYIATNPAFRLRPVGGEGSPARMQQLDAIAAEDAFRDALAPFTGCAE